MPYAAVPTLRLALRIDSGGRAMHALALNVQVRIAAQRRRYQPESQDALRELFGKPEDWARSISGVPWTQVALNVGPFEGATIVDLPVPCSYDFDVAANKYLAALRGGDIPVDVLFNGTMHYPGADGRPKIAMVPWDREASAQVPVAAWREAADSAFPDQAWLRVRRETFDRLQAVRGRRSATSWEELLEHLLDSEEQL